MDHRAGSNHQILVSLPLDHIHTLSNKKRISRNDHANPQMNYSTNENVHNNDNRGHNPVAGNSRKSFSRHNLPNNSAGSTRLKQTPYNPAHRIIRQAKSFTYDCNEPNPGSETIKPKREPNIATRDYSNVGPIAPEIIEMSDDDDVDENNEDTDMQHVDIPITNKNGTVANNANDNQRNNRRRLLISSFCEWLDLMESHTNTANDCNENAYTASAAPPSASETDDEDDGEADSEEDDTKLDDDDETFEKPKEKNNIPDFELPPEYDPVDSRWTLKYKKHSVDLQEVIPKSGVYINAIYFKYIQMTAKDASDLALGLMPEIFSDAALRVCSLKGARRVSHPNIPRPGLDANAVETIIKFVYKHGEKNNWKTYNTNIHSVMSRKLLKLRKKEIEP